MTEPVGGIDPHQDTFTDRSTPASAAAWAWAACPASILTHKSYFCSAVSSLLGLRSCELISRGLLNKDRQPCPMLLEKTQDLSREVRRNTLGIIG
ncbi:hypothetical protein [Candidatus Poriferisodalis sp.]|uniref:hypothetical protein n=1 Tax=Candidatus Poriferisodalis sp. TaxID=3101277 RepID=UPI003B013A7C